MLRAFLMCGGLALACYGLYAAVRDFYNSFKRENLYNAEDPFNNFL